MISGFNTHREMASKSSMDQFSTSTGNRDDSPLSESDDEFNYGEEDNDDSGLAPGSNQISTDDMADFQYDEWYDRIDELEIDLDINPNYKKSIIENRSLKVVVDTAKRLRALRLKFQANQKERFIKQKKILLNRFNKRM